MNTQFLIDTINKPLVTYNPLYGTKYRLNRCGLLIGSIGVLTGISVSLVVNKSFKKYLVPISIALGSGTVVLLLTKNNYSMKPKISSRGIEYVKNIIIKQIDEDFGSKSELCKAASRCLEHASDHKLALDKTTNNLTSIDKKSNSNLVAINNKLPINRFKDNAILLSTYMNDKINEIKKIRNDILEGKQKSEYKDLEICNLKLNDYQEALLHINVFIYMEDNTKIFELLDLLQGILSYEDLQQVDNILLQFFLVDNPKDTIARYNINLVNWANYYMHKSREIRKNITLMQDKFNLKINSYGIIEFSNENKLLDKLAK